MFFNFLHLPSFGGVGGGLLSQSQHTLHQFQVSGVNKTVLAQMALTGLRFLRQQVAFKGLVPAYFSGACNLKGLLCTGVSLHLWHGLNFGMAKV